MGLSWQNCLGCMRNWLWSPAPHKLGTLWSMSVIPILVMWDKTIRNSSLCLTTCWVRDHSGLQETQSQKEKLKVSLQILRFGQETIHLTIKQCMLLNRITTGRIHSSIMYHYVQAQHQFAWSVSVYYLGTPVSTATTTTKKTWTKKPKNRVMVLVLKTLERPGSGGACF